MNEYRLVEGCRHGDARAQRALFEVHAGPMLMLCRRYLQQEVRAEEALLSGFEKFFRTIDRFVYTAEGSVAPWLRKIMVNECLLVLRQKNMFIVRDELREEVAGDEDAVAKMGADEILKVISAMPEGYRTVFNLYVIEGYTHGEIAAMLELSEGTSKSQLAKAKNFLQKELRKRGVVYG
ncbi:MAG: sigma-70 family RNA polymerase sigma factor [Taibaiella sp.]|nr:sigma-70 family RNA polymerase sigma factor [Taibaiella sp.]